MRSLASYVFNLTTFGQFSKDKQPKGTLYKSTLATYLLLSHATLLLKKELDRHRMESAYKDKSYDEKAAQVQRDFMAMREDLKAGASVSSSKNTTHQFAQTVVKPTHRLDSRFLNKARLDAQGCFVDVEANMSFGDLMKSLHQAGYRVPLVPEFLDITVGGAFVGVAIESSGHKFGLFHEHVLQAEVLMPDGELKTVSLKQYADEFHILPNSNGTLGRIMRLRLPLIPLKSAHPDQQCHPFLDEERKDDYLASEEPAWLEHNKPMPASKNTEHVHLQYLRFDNTEAALKQLKIISEAKECDFIESVVLSPNNAVIIVGNIVENIDGIASDLCHNYQTRDVFYQHVIDKQRSENYVPLLDYYARWHQTVFWNTQTHGPLTKLLNHPTFRKIFRRFMGPGFLAMLGNARDLWNEHIPPASPQAPEEHMVQDIGIPQERAAEFARWYEKEIALYPVWLCPVKATDDNFPSFTMKHKGSYVDWGMFTGEGKPEHPDDPKHYTHMIEEKIITVEGNKALYSDNAVSPEQFNTLYNTDAYNTMKARMDPDNIYPHVYDKMVKAQLNKSKNCAPLRTQLPFSFDAFALLTLCAGVSIGGSLLASVWSSQSLLGMSTLGLAVGATAFQVSRLFSRAVTKEPVTFSRGISGWVSVTILASSLAVMNQTGWNSVAMAAALLTIPTVSSVVQSQLNKAAIRPSI